MSESIELAKATLDHEGVKIEFIKGHPINASTDQAHALRSKLLDDISDLTYAAMKKAEAL